MSIKMQENKKIELGPGRLISARLTFREFSKFVFSFSIVLDRLARISMNTTILFGPLANLMNVQRAFVYFVASVNDDTWLHFRPIQFSFSSLKHLKSFSLKATFDFIAF